MKYLIIIFITFFADLYGQTSIDKVIENIHTYKTKSHKWSDNNSRPLNFKSTVYSIFKDTLNSFCSDFDTVPDLNNFHLIDIDADKDLDVVFNGKECNGFESQTVIIYLNINGQYERSLNTSGKIISLNKSKDLTVYEYPCCAMTENSFVIYDISKDKISFQTGVTFFDSFLLHGKTPGASKTYDHMTPKALKLIDTLLVKEGAVFNYVPKDTIIDGTYIKNNRIASTLNQTSVKVFASYTDQNGDKWFYCKISNEDIKSSQKKLKYPILAWVRQKYCS